MKLFPEILARNWQLKVSAFALAVLLWTFPRLESQNRQILEDVPVRVQLDDPEWVLRGDPLPPAVRVSLSGPARELFALAVDQPSIVVPVDRVVSADTAVHLRLPWLRIPDREGVVVESMEPSSVRLSFEPMDVVEVPLAVRLEGRLPDTLSLAEPPTLSDSLVRVRGAASRLSALDSVFLVPLDLSGIEASGAFALSVDTIGLGGMAVSLRVATVGVRVEETVERVLADLPVVVPPLDLDPPLQARPASVTVTLTGARSLVDAVVPEDLRVAPPVGQAATLYPGEERDVRVVVEGLSNLVRATVAPVWVALRRPVGS
ncbi:YbbR-like domain-containing protein [Gemmatimonadota bacterium]